MPLRHSANCLILSAAGGQKERIAMSASRVGRRDVLGRVAALGGIMRAGQGSRVSPAEAAAVAGDSIISAPASELAAAIRSKEVSSRIVVEAYLERIAKVNPKINA